MARARRAPFFLANLKDFDFRSSITRSGIKIAVTGPQASSPCGPKRSTCVMMAFREPLPYRCVECQNRIGKGSKCRSSCGWQASQEVEEIGAVKARKPLTKSPEQGPDAAKPRLAGRAPATSRASMKK